MTAIFLLPLSLQFNQRKETKLGGELLLGLLSLLTTHPVYAEEQPYGDLQTTLIDLRIVCIMRFFPCFLQGKEGEMTNNCTAQNEV